MFSRQVRQKLNWIIYGQADCEIKSFPLHKSDVVLLLGCSTGVFHGACWGHFGPKHTPGNCLLLLNFLNPPSFTHFHSDFRHFFCIFQFFLLVFPPSFEGSKYDGEEQDPILILALFVFCILGQSTGIQDFT